MAKSAPPNRQEPSEAVGSGDYLIDVSADSSNHELLILTHCPICGDQLIDDLENRDQVNPDLVDGHIATHSPADLDLDGPYHFTPMADILIKLHGLDTD